MTILKILTYPDDFLSQETKPVEEINDGILKLIDDMAETMYAAPGAGLAASQVGSDKMIIVYDDKPGEEQRSLKVMINPTITNMEGSTVSEQEGCLSVPDFRADVKRAESIRVEYLDREGNSHVLDVDEFLAVVLQHEIDHLNGILFIDRISSLKRKLDTQPLPRSPSEPPARRVRVR